MNHSPFQRLAFLACAVLLAACGKLEPRTAQLNDACTRNADCAENLVCLDSRCVVEPGRECSPGKFRCNGDGLEKCRTGGDGWAFERVCATGCQLDQCLPPVCESGAKKCEGDNVFSCLDNGAGFAFTQSCPSGCADGACKAPICTPFLTRCKGGTMNVLQSCDSRGAALLESTCGDTAPVCVDGACLPRICAASTTPREARCRGDVRETCGDTGTRFDATEVCEFGCKATGSTASCLAPACAVGEEKCDGDAFLRCAPERRGFAFVQFCPAGCTATAGRAACTLPICTPLSRKCGQDATTSAFFVQQCNAAGSAYEAVESCPQACASGACVFSDAGCTPGERRCNGKEVQLCVRPTSTGGTEWRFEERCLGACLGSACDGTGACGCAGGGGFGDRCGSSTRPPVVVRNLIPAGTTLYGDNASTFLLYTDTILNALSEPVPDGTLVTFTHDGNDSLFQSADADPNKGGLQRPTTRGQARVVIKAPNGARNVLVSATLGGSCSGAVLIPFLSALPVSQLRPVFVGEDFSTTRILDRTTTTAQWDVARGRLRATAVFSLGTGADGDLTATGGGTRDLSDDGLAKGANVLAIGDAEVVLDTLSHGLSAGDEVLIATVFGQSPGSVGAYEFRLATAVQGNRIVLDRPLTTTFGNGNNTDLVNQKVMLQRVPQFNNVTIDAGATLTARSYANGGTGMLAFRAKGTVKVNGRIDMSARGLPAGVTQPAVGNSALSKFLLGSGGASNPGGGVVFVAARTLTVKTDSGTVSGIIAANSSGGNGGAAWVQGGSLTLSIDRVQATGATTSLDGRVRLDYGALDTSVTTRPIAFVGQAGGMSATTLVAYTEPTVTAGAQPSLRAVNLLGVLGGTNRITIGLPASIPGVHVDVSIDNGANYSNIDVGRVTYGVGNRFFRFRTRLDTLTDEPLDVYGVAFKLEAQP